MAKRTRTVAAGQFKARCLALLDEVAATHQEIVVTKRGRPVARVVPIEGSTPPSLVGSVIAQGDLLAPIDVPWDAAR